MIRVVVGNGATLTHRVTNGEDVVTPDAAPSVTVTDYAGATVATLTGTLVGGVYSAALPPQSAVSTLQAKWTWLFGGIAYAAIETIEIVGGYYFELYDLRQMPDLQSTVRYPADELAKARNFVEDRIDNTCRTSFVLRSRFDTYNSISCVGLVPISDRYARTIQSIIVDGTVFDITKAVISSGYIGASTSWPSGDVANFRYIGGYSTECPTDISAAARIAARNYLLTTVGASGIPNRSLGMTNEFGNIRMAQPGPRSPFGLPDVDAVIMAWADRLDI